MDSFIVAQQVIPATTGAGTVQASPPTPVPEPKLGYDGGLILQVTGYWLLALILIFSVFYFTPKSPKQSFA